MLKPNPVEEEIDEILDAHIRKLPITLEEMRRLILNVMDKNLKRVRHSVYITKEMEQALKNSKEKK